MCCRWRTAITRPRPTTISSASRSQRTCWSGPSVETYSLELTTFSATWIWLSAPTATPSVRSFRDDQGGLESEEGRPGEATPGLTRRSSSTTSRGPAIRRNGTTSMRSRGLWRGSWRFCSQNSAQDRSSEGAGVQTADTRKPTGCSRRASTRRWTSTGTAAAPRSAPALSSPNRDFDTGAPTAPHRIPAWRTIPMRSWPESWRTTTPASIDPGCGRTFWRSSAT